MEFNLTVDDVLLLSSLGIKASEESLTFDESSCTTHLRSLREYLEVEIECSSKT